MTANHDPKTGSATSAAPATRPDPPVVTAATALYVTRPTRWTLFLRTFLPWQLWKFIRINLKMFGIIFRSKNAH